MNGTLLPRAIMVKAAVLVHVGAVVDEPAEPVEVFEVDLVADEGLRARFPERLEQRRAAVLARVVERVVVPLAPVHDEQLDEGRVVAVDGAANGREVPVPALLDLARERVRVGARLEQEPGACADVGVASQSGGGGGGAARGRRRAGARRPGLPRDRPRAPRGRRARDGAGSQAARRSPRSAARSAHRAEDVEVARVGEESLRVAGAQPTAAVDLVVERQRSADHAQPPVANPLRPPRLSVYDVDGSSSSSAQTRPVSSATSRTAHASSVSPGSHFPLGTSSRRSPSGGRRAPRSPSRRPGQGRPLPPGRRSCEGFAARRRASRRRARRRSCRACAAARARRTGARIVTALGEPRLDPRLRDHGVLVLAENVLEVLRRPDEAACVLAELVRGELGRVAGALRPDPRGVERGSGELRSSRANVLRVRRHSARQTSCSVVSRPELPARPPPRAARGAGVPVARQRVDHEAARSPAPSRERSAAHERRRALRRVSPRLP